MTLSETILRTGRLILGIDDDAETPTRREDRQSGEVEYDEPYDPEFDEIGSPVGADTNSPWYPWEVTP